MPRAPLGTKLGKIAQSALICVLLAAGTALARSDVLLELYQKHYQQLSAAYRHHQRFLMEDGSRALRVARKHGALPPDGMTIPPEEDEKTEDEAAGKKEPSKTESEPDPLAARQIYTAAQELRSVATALQRPPLAPEGNWNAKAQALKVAATKLFRISTHPGDLRIPLLVARSREACYGCHRVYGGPLEEKALLGEGPDDYDDPLKLPQLRRIKTKD